MSSIGYSAAADGSQPSRSVRETCGAHTGGVDDRVLFLREQPQVPNCGPAMTLNPSEKSMGIPRRSNGSRPVSPSTPACQSQHQHDQRADRDHGATDTTLILPLYPASSLPNASPYTSHRPPSHRTLCRPRHASVSPPYWPSTPSRSGRCIVGE